MKNHILFAALMLIIMGAIVEYCLYKNAIMLDGGLLFYEQVFVELWFWFACVAISFEIKPKKNKGVVPT